MKLFPICRVRVKSPLRRADDYIPELYSSSRRLPEQWILDFDRKHTVVYKAWD